jgi:hypothetical protein
MAGSHASRGGLRGCLSSGFARTTACRETGDCQSDEDLCGHVGLLRRDVADQGLRSPRVNGERAMGAHRHQRLRRVRPRGRRRERSSSQRKSHRPLERSRVWHGPSRVRNACGCATRSSNRLLAQVRPAPAVRTSARSSGIVRARRSARRSALHSRRVARVKTMDGSSRLFFKNLGVPLITYSVSRAKSQANDAGSLVSATAVMASTISTNVAAPAFVAPEITSASRIDSFASMS